MLTSEIRTPSQTVAKAELFLSTLGLTAKDMMVSIYETRTGIRVPSQHLSSSQSGWLSLPVTKMINQLLAREGTSFRFKPVLVKKRGRNKSAFDLRPLQVPRVWLVVYTEADQEQPFHLLARDGIRGSTDDRRRRDLTPSEMPKGTKNCRKEDMNITSMDLTSFAKIVYPSHFNAYQCSGKCSVTDKTINHSILRALVIQKRGITSDGEPCCVPTKLKSIVLIFSTDNGGFVMRTVGDMIVEKCGCSG